MHLALYYSVEIKLGVNKMVWSGCFVYTPNANMADHSVVARNES